MHVEDVSSAYKLVLGRKVESDALAIQLASIYSDPLELLIDLLKSEEFLAGRGQRLKEYSVPSIEDMNIFRAFGRYTGPGTPGFVTDFLGIRTDVKFISHLSSMSGGVESYPFPHGNFHGDLIEWLGTLMSVIDAKDSMTVLELGAGWGPWLVACTKAAAIHGIKKVRLVGVEGSSAHVDFMKRHLEFNAITADQKILHGIVGVKDGTAEFPVAPDPAADWGLAAFFDQSTTSDYRGVNFAKTESVPVYSLDTLLATESVVNLIHIDIQGAEGDVIKAGIESLNRKVKAIVVGTHRRGIEDDLMLLLRDAGWVLCRESACRVALGPQTGIAVADGCQFWRNKRFFSDL